MLESTNEGWIMYSKFHSVVGRYGHSCLSILYVGAHRGRSISCLCTDNLQTLVCVEPNIHVYQELLTAVQEIKEKGVPDCRVIMAAASDTCRKQLFFTSSNDGHSSSLLRPTEHIRLFPDVAFSSETDVDTIALDSLSRETSFDTLILDSGGSEFSILNSSPNLLSDVNCVLCKLYRNSLYETCSSPGAIDGLLYSFGFTRAETSWHGPWGHGIYVKEKVLSKVFSPEFELVNNAALVSFCDKTDISLEFMTGQTTLPGLFTKDTYFLIARKGRAGDDCSHRINALYVAHIGNYCNRMMQLFNSMLIGSILDTTTILVDNVFNLPSSDNSAISSFTFRRAERAISEAGSIVLKGTFWNPKGALKTQFYMVSFGLARKIRQQFQDIFNVSTKCDPVAPRQGHDIVIHFRGGDVFPVTGLPHPFYVQPPLSYYQICIKHVMESHMLSRLDRIIVVYQDKQNPVVQPFIDWLHKLDLVVFEQSSDFLHDFNTMANSTVFVTSAGSVSEAVLLQSTSISTVYYFKTFGRGFEAEYTGHGFYQFIDSTLECYCVEPKKEYIKPGEWRNTAEQRKIMLHYQCDKEDINLQPARGMNETDIFFY